MVKFIALQYINSRVEWAIEFDGPRNLSGFLNSLHSYPELADGDWAGYLVEAQDWFLLNDFRSYSGTRIDYLDYREQSGLRGLVTHTGKDWTMEGLAEHRTFMKERFQ